MIYTIGYGNRQWKVFIELLKDQFCDYLIDVRSYPSSKFNPSFTQNKLSELCAYEGVRYVFMGDTLGGKPASKALYDDNGKPDYIKMAKTTEFNNGLDRLLVANNKGLNVVLMCSELFPQNCHRALLIGKELSIRNVDVMHIDGDRKLVSQVEVMNRLTDGQDDLFDSKSELSSSNYVDQREEVEDVGICNPMLYFTEDKNDNLLIEFSGKNFG